jgi:glucuronate isomerase
MKEFLDENFLLETKTAQRLYHEYAKAMPIIDYHNHLPQQQIAADAQFANMTQIWLAGDHYKWRAMRANGVNEAFITGDKPDAEKFLRWAETVPYTMRNPLYHWTHLELQRYFDIKEILSPSTAQSIYKQCNEQLQTQDFSVRNLLRRMNVKQVCTTDDPLDSLNFHQELSNSDFEIGVAPAFRPDKAMNPDDLEALNQYIDKLESVSNISVSDYDSYLKALKSRHDYFAENGCSISDHGLEQIYAEDYEDAEIRTIFNKIRSRQSLDALEALKFRSAMLYEFALWDHEKGWVQQFHLGALRNNNRRALKQLGPDTGWDSIGDFSQAGALSRFLDRLDADNRLTKTIIYNLNPADNDVMAAMIGNFNDGSVAGKIQFGSAWWFGDQKEGMTKQLNTLSNIGLLSRMVGMLTDSRSFLSFPRHEYFRRILCNLYGQDVENGELPNDVEWIGKMIQDICYYNAKNYFNFATLK